MGKRCIICRKTKGLSFITDNFSKQCTISDALARCFNIQFLDENLKKRGVLKMCKMCVVRLKYCCSFRKDVERAHDILYAGYITEQEQRQALDNKVEDDTDDQYIVIVDDESEFLDAYNNEVFIDENTFLERLQYMNNNCGDTYNYEVQMQGGNEIVESDWSVDTSDVLNATGYEQEIRKITKKKEITVPLLDEGATVCPICNVAFTRPQPLMRHYKSHFPNHLCHICGRSYFKSPAYRNHMSWHAGRVFTCHDCPRTFKDNVALMGHRKITHLGIDRIVCKVCKARFKNVKAKVKHQVEVHNMFSEKFTCLYCTFRYTTDSEQRVHLLEKHFDIHNYKCVECSMVFITRVQLVGHNSACHGIKEFKCQLCDKQYTKGNQFKRHLKLHQRDLNELCLKENVYPCKEDSS